MLPLAWDQGVGCHFVTTDAATGPAPLHCEGNEPQKRKLPRVGLGCLVGGFQSKGFLCCFSVGGCIGGRYQLPFQKSPLFNTALGLRKAVQAVGEGSRRLPVAFVSKTAYST